MMSEGWQLSDVLQLHHTKNNPNIILLHFCHMFQCLHAYLSSWNIKLLPAFHRIYGNIQQRDEYLPHCAGRSMRLCSLMG